MCSSQPKQWAHWLPYAEYWHNTCYHTAICMSPFEALYGYKPTPLVLPHGLQSSVIGLEQTLHMQQLIQHQLKHLLTQAQDRMKKLADKHRVERVFNIGDWVYLKLKPYRQLSLQRIGAVAYKLQLPPTFWIHPLFHVSFLSGKLVTLIDLSYVTAFDDDGKVVMRLVAILGRRLVKRNNKGRAPLCFVAHLPVDEATWEDIGVLTKKFPHLLS
ncbi:hypothetical protein DH2020_042040 [Rehmannia glutinosa]|uniref:Tf2-1-like SH3-like domain-containing protein n=1 Tax=Rehmannia glutinosa TaxID=99300 RepID=A0ABR0UNE6_REHGL